jgi:glycerate kinase
MKVVIAIDSLKGSLSSIEAAKVIKEAILKTNSSIDVVMKPLADGGEGTLEALIASMNGTLYTTEVTGPILKKVKATYGILEDNSTAIMEMAQANGLPLVPNELRNPLNTTTYGAGEMIKEAISKGCRKFIVGIGGSSTNDCGIGMLQALGFEFYNKEGTQVEPCGKELKNIVKIETKNKLKELDECIFKVACDVSNPLYGKNGAAYVYGPQKGATEEIIEELDLGLRNFSEVMKKYLNKDVSTIPGTGAAGGLGAAFLAFLNSKLESGVEIVLEETNLEKEIADSDFVITGEGRMDFQTSMGKAPIGVAKLAKKHNVPVIGLAGSVTRDVIETNKQGIVSAFSIINEPMTLEKAMNREVTEENLTQTTIQIFNLINCLSKK